MKRVSVMGVVVGAVADIVASNVAAFPILVVAATKVDVRSLPKQEQGHALLQAVQATHSLFAAQLLLGSACSVLGGYIAARIAKHDQVLNGALSAFLCVGLGVYALLAKSDGFSPLTHAALFVASPLCGALGGYLAERGSRSTAGPPVAPTTAA